MKPMKPIYVVGGANTTYIGRGHPDFIWKRHPDFGVRTNPTIEDHLKEATLSALDVSGVPASAIEKGYVSNFLGECFSKQGHLGAMLAAVHPDLETKPFSRIEAACASGAAAISACIDAMHTGVDVTLAVGVEVETNSRSKDGVDYMARAAHYAKERELSEFTFPYFFARRARAYKEHFGATDTDIAHVVAKAYGNASRNPQALNRTTETSVEDAATVSKHNYVFLEDDALRDHCKLLDCTAFTDGGSAVILATEEGLAKLGIDKSQCTEILSVGHSVSALGAQTDPTRLVNMQQAAQLAYTDAGLGPKDMQIAEVHDCFSINELLHYDALGLSEPGQAPRLIKDGHTQIDGKIPVNTGGGLLGFGHPIGATGVKQVVEIWRQMKGRAGDYQVPTIPTHGITANLGGDDRTGIVMTHRNCE